MSNAPELKPAFRRWMQFSLRSLLLLTLLCAIGLVLWPLWIKPYQRQAEVVALLTDGKADVKSRTLLPDWLNKRFYETPPVVAESVYFRAADDEALALLRDLADLQELRVGNERITDAGLAHLTGLRQLQTLSLPRQRFTDRGLQHLSGLHSLARLNLSGNGITDAGMMHIAGLENLTRLNLSRTGITSAGCQHLKSLARLQRLDLEGTEVLDAGLESLSTLHTLRELTLTGTKVSDEGVRMLLGLQQLRHLGLDRTKVTLACLEHLQRFPSLESVELPVERLPLHSSFRETQESRELLDNSTKPPGLTWDAIARALPELARRRIDRGLKERVDVEVTGLPLVKAISQLKECAELEIQVDLRGFATYGIDPNQAVTFDCAGKSLKTVLNELLPPLGLTYIVWDRMLIVTPQARITPQPSPLQGIDGPGKTPALANVLVAPTVLQFITTPLDDVCDYLSEYHMYAIRIDPKSPRPVVTINLRRVALRPALEFMLDQLDLVGVHDGNTLWIRRRNEPEELE